jgi:hypothetical protein
MNYPRLLDEYIEKSYTGIVCLKRESHEQTRGHNDEVGWEEIVCHVDGIPYRVGTRWIEKTFGGLESQQELKERISGEDYNELVQNHGGPVDTAVYREELRMRRTLEAKQCGRFRPRR